MTDEIDRKNELGKSYEMLWDCQFCGTTKLLGHTHRFCPNCGAPQDPDSRYFPSDEEKIAVEDHIYTGKDRTCPSCGALCSAAEDFCHNCGAPLEGAEVAATLASQSIASGQKFESSGSRDVTKEAFDAEMQRVGVTGKKKSINPIIIVIGVLAVIAVVVGGFIILTAKTEATAVVTGHSWERQITIEEFASVPGEAWQDQVPFDAYGVSCSRAQRSTRQVQDGETCQTIRVDQGDGTFRMEEQCRPVYRSEPVYDDLCRFTVDRWVDSDVVDTEGTSLSDTPIWGDMDLNCEGQSRLGCEREAGRSEAYTVYFRVDDRDYECRFDQDVWEQIPIESLWNAQVGTVLKNLDCNSLQLAR